MYRGNGVNCTEFFLYYITEMFNGNFLIPYVLMELHIIALL